MKKRAVVTGAGGFIGHHLCRFLKEKGYWVRGVDKVYSLFLNSNEYDEFLIRDLRSFRGCMEAVNGADIVYALAAQNGSIEFTSKIKVLIVRDNALINLNTAEACCQSGVERVFFSSSACTYPLGLQTKIEAKPLKENDVYPAFPDSEYGWEKLFSERLYKSYQEETGVKARIARFFNIYGPEGHYDPLYAKAPTSLSRKVALAENGGEVKVWGDGKQTRSFCYIDDCIRAIYKIANSDYEQPVNVATRELVSINQLVDKLSKIAGKDVVKKHQLDRAQGVRGRHANISRAENKVGWKPEHNLDYGLEKTYKWVEKELENE